MWITLAIVVLVAAALGYVWLRQRHHPVPPGSREDPNAQVQQKGAFWGSSPGIF